MPSVFQIGELVLVVVHIMVSTDFLKSIGDVKTPFALAAFAIAAVLTIFNAFVAKPTSTGRKALWFVVAAICVLAIVPIAIDAVMQNQRILTIYRVRVTALDARNVPAGGATVRVTAANEGKTAPDGSCELSIPKGSLPSSGKVTIYADKDDSHGSVELTLQSDPNPSVIIHLLPDQTAGLRGVVEDEDRHAVVGVRVSVPGAKTVVTDDDGNFSFPPFAAPGQQVRLHAEKPGFKPLDQYHPAGNASATLLLEREDALHKRR